VPTPEVGNQPKLIEKMTMATMAIQKSGAEAPTSETIETSRSKKPPTLKAASAPSTIAATMTRAMVISARGSVQV
jgi:hypothetical protein